MLRWNVGNKYYVQSDEGYRVAMNCVGPNIIYTAWCPLHHRIAQRSSQEAAQQFCSDHFAGKLTKQAETKRNAM